MTKHFGGSSRGLLIAGLVAGIAIPALGSECCKGPDCCKDKKSTATVALGAGLQIHLDAAGNRLTEPPKGGSALPAALKSVPAESIKRTATGGLKMDGSQFMSASVATIGSDGKVKVDCVTTNAVPAEARK